MEPGKQGPWSHVPSFLWSSARVLLDEPKWESESMGACWCNPYKSVSRGREQGGERQRVNLERQMEVIWHRTCLLNYKLLNKSNGFCVVPSRTITQKLAFPRCCQCGQLTACSWVPLQGLHLHFRPFPSYLYSLPKTAHIYDMYTRCITVQQTFPNSR